MTRALLPHPGGFEGFVVVPEDLTPCDLALCDPDHRPVAELHWNAAARAASRDDVLGEDPVITPVRFQVNARVNTRLSRVPSSGLMLTVIGLAFDLVGAGLLSLGPFRPTQLQL